MPAAFAGFNDYIFRNVTKIEHLKALTRKKYNFWPKNIPLINSMDIITKQKDDSQICICFIAKNIYWTNSLVIKDERVKNFLMNVNNGGIIKMFFLCHLCHLHHTVFKINPHKLQILILVSTFRMRFSFLVLRIYWKISTISMKITFSSIVIGKTLIIKQCKHIAPT